MTSRIPSSFIDELLARVDLVELIDMRVPLRRAGKDYQACCPFHEERTASFTVSPAKQFYHCFGCGAHGTAIGFLMQYDRLSFPEAVGELAQRAGLPVPKEAESAQKLAQESEGLAAALTRARDFYARQLRETAGAAAVAYLKGRGVTGAMAQAFGLGYAPDEWNALKALGQDAVLRDALAEAGLLIRREGREYDRFRGRLMFPIEDYRGRIIGFGGRLLGPGEPKYLNSPETPLFHKGKELYGLFRAREAIRQAGQVVVVEGYMDVIALVQHGIGHVVATLGTALSAEQLERLYRFAPEVVLCFDGDRAGQAAAWRAVEVALPVLHEGRQLGFVFLPETEDPDSFVRREGAEAFKARLADVDPLPEFFFRTLTGQTDMDRLDGRAKLAELARPLLSKLNPGVFRTLMLGQLSALIGIPSDQIARGWGWKEAPPAESPRLPARKPSTGPRGGLSDGKLALALLVQRPELASAAGPFEELALSARRSLQLLERLLRHLKEEPATSTAQILERFADSEDLPALLECARAEHLALNLEGPAGFSDLIMRLRQKAIQERIQALLERSALAQGGLPAPEAEELARLMRLRSQGRAG